MDRSRAMPFDAGCLSACGSTADAVCIEGCFQPEAPLVPIGAAIPLAGALVLLSGLFSGLNLGLLSLDLTGLKVRQRGSARRRCHGVAGQDAGCSSACSIVASLPAAPWQPGGPAPCAAPAALQVVEQSGEQLERKYAGRLIRGESGSSRQRLTQRQRMPLPGYTV